MRRLLYVCAFLAAAFPVGVHALTFMPAATDLTVRAGESGDVTFYAKNDTTEGRTYALDLYAVTFADDGSPAFAPLAERYASWFTPDAETFVLTAGEERAITLNIAPPADAASATVTAAAVLREEQGAGSGVTIDTAISGLIFVTVGDVPTEATLLQFSSSSLFVGRLPVTFSAIFRNDAERILQPWGVVMVRDMFGSEVAVLDLNLGKYRVLPGRARTYEVVWQKGRETGGFFAELWREVADRQVGVFTATLIAEPYPGAPTPVTATARVFLVPWRTMLVCAVVLASALLARRRR